MKNSLLITAAVLAGVSAVQAQTATPAAMATPTPMMTSATIGAMATPTPAMTPSTTADAVPDVLTTAPTGAYSIQRFYDQNVYDGAGAKVGTIKDALVQNGNKLDAFVISVGGFLGMGEKDVLVPFHAVTVSMKNNKPWLTIAATKDELKSAPGVKLDSAKEWVSAS
jgi:sporulation protein YlmC with PRC-barrel domain